MPSHSDGRLSQFPVSGEFSPKRAVRDRIVEPIGRWQPLDRWSHGAYERRGPAHRAAGQDRRRTSSAGGWGSGPPGRGKIPFPGRWQASFQPGCPGRHLPGTRPALAENVPRDTPPPASQGLTGRTIDHSQAASLVGAPTEWQLVADRGQAIWRPLFTPFAARKAPAAARKTPAAARQTPSAGWDPMLDFRTSPIAAGSPGERGGGKLPRPHRRLRGSKIFCHLDEFPRAMCYSQHRATNFLKPGRRLAGRPRRGGRRATCRGGAEQAGHGPKGRGEFSGRGFNFSQYSCRCKPIQKSG